MTEFDLVRWPNYIAETCKMTNFLKTVNLNWLSLTEIKVKINFGQTQTLRFTVLLFGPVTKVFGLLLFGHLAKSYSVIFFWSSWLASSSCMRVVSHITFLFYEFLDWFFLIRQKAAEYKGIKPIFVKHFFQVFRLFFFE